MGKKKFEHKFEPGKLYLLEHFTDDESDHPNAWMVVRTLYAFEIDKDMKERSLKCDTELVWAQAVYVAEEFEDDVDLWTAGQQYNVQFCWRRAREMSEAEVVKIVTLGSV